MARFAETLAALIDRRFKSRREFARTAEPSREEGAAAAYVSQVITGKKPPPLDRIESWADALGLDGEVRQAFLNAAALTHAPAVVQARVTAMEAELRTLRDLVARALAAQQPASAAAAEQALQVRYQAADLGSQGIAPIKPSADIRPGRKA